MASFVMGSDAQRLGPAECFWLRITYQHHPKGIVLMVLNGFWYMKPTKQHPLGGPSRFCFIRVILFLAF